MRTSMLFVPFALALATTLAQIQIPHQPNIADFLTTPKPYIPIISRNEVRDDSGQVISSYQSADGTFFEQVDVLKPSLNPSKPKVIVQQGTYSYISPDGTPVQVSYIADEMGFRAVGTHIFGEVPQLPQVPDIEISTVAFPAPPPVSFPPQPSEPARVPSPPESFPPPLPVPAHVPFPVAFPPPPPAPLPTPLPGVSFPTTPPTPVHVPGPAVVTKSANPTFPAPSYPYVMFPSVPGSHIDPSTRGAARKNVWGRV